MQLALFDASPTRSEAPRSATARAQQGAAHGRAGGELVRAGLDERVHAYTEAAHAENTRRAYRSDWAGFEAWCAEHGEVAMPANSSTLARYLAFLADSGKKASTIRRARVAVGLAHGWAGEVRPDKDVTIRTVERGIARTHGAREEGAEALMASDLPKLVKAFRGGPRDDRDRAVILLGFAGAFRASELVGLNIEQLEFNASGLRIFVARSKEDQTGKGAFVDVPRGESEVTCSVRAVSAWLGRVGRNAGPLFRVVRGTVIEHERMHVGAVGRAVQRTCTKAGLEGDYSAHSLRVGLATSAHMAGASVTAIQRHGRWLDRRSVERYFRPEPMYGAANPARGLM
jgi:site-specific recombinase XerD